MRPSDPISTKIIADAHVELLRGSRRITLPRGPRGN
jgi:hypothetical protein